MRLLVWALLIAAAVTFYLWVTQGEPAKPREFKQFGLKETFTHHHEVVENGVQPISPTPKIDADTSPPVGGAYMTFRESFPKLKDAQ